MRRLFGAVILGLSLATLCAAAPAPPSAAPIVTPRPLLPNATPTPKAAYAPAVIVYPFDQTGQMNANVGVSIAQIFSQVFVEAGNLTVLPVGQKVKRADFLTNARAQKADFYIGGYVTPIGNGAAVVEQVVKIDSGVIVYSQTAQIYSVPDVTSLALTTHNVILQAAGVALDVSPAPRATATTDVATANGAQVNIGGLGSLVQGLFRRTAKNGATPAPSAAATPVTKPPRGVIVARVTGTSASAASASDELARRLAVNYNVTPSNVPGATAATSADTICGNNRNNSIAAGSLDTTGSGRHATTTFTLKVYTCFGAVLYQTAESNVEWHRAVDAAVADFVKANPGNI